MRMVIRLFIHLGRVSDGCPLGARGLGEGRDELDLRPVRADAGAANSFLQRSG